MTQVITAFARDEEGAVTVDWVVLTALIVGLQLVVLLTPIREALTGVSNSIATKIETADDGPAP